MNFPDLPHFRQVQKDLWQWPKSRAAVMVGAGLSLNAEPLPGVKTRFPTWRQLVRAMFDEMHPAQLDETPEQTKAREDKFNSANPLRIASEYEAAFDRRKLDQLVRTLNPDSDHQPGKLHHLLMQLPWVDVFTTNYDTLLERTEIFGRTYHPVTRASELTTAFAPRIVKLHGSFPSQTPFIVTEEDYRTYPREFAPFVNTVQQSLLENIFVLIGFSGDDPNFLEWTGWIRDELGGNHGPIYLVGALSARNAERSLLARRGVMPIDLSPIFDGISPPNGVYAASIELFLKRLWDARPLRPEKWPKLDRDSASPTDGLPPMREVGLVVPKSIETIPDPRIPLSHQSVLSVVTRWRFERENYPGWIVADENKRSRVFLETESWIYPLIEFAKDWPPVDRLLLFREINWRLETAMVPLFTRWIEAFDKAVDELFEPLEQGRSVQPSMDLIRPKDTSASEIPDVWLEIAFGLLREARETYNADRWSLLKAKIDKVVQRYPQHADRNHYEDALWRIWDVDRESTKATLSRWQPSSRFPRAAMWKAGLLAELDELGEARTVLQGALLEVRRALRRQGQNIELLSLEGWCTYLLSAVELSLSAGSRSAVRDEFWERWQELKVWDCSPGPYIEYFEKVLAAIPPKRQKVEQRIHGFDPGQVTLSRRLGGDYIGPYLPAFACIRYYEQVGAPMRLRSVNIAGDALKNACRWIAPFIDFWSPALLVRAGKVGDLTKEDFLSRTQVAAMDSALAKRLYTWCLKILERELTALAGGIASGSAQESLVAVLSEVLSRLAFKVESDDHRRTFPFVLKLYGNRAVWFHITLRDSCVRWFQRLFDAADSQLLLEWLPELIRAPLFVTTTDDGWRDPIRHFPPAVGHEARGRYPEIAAKISDAINWLLKRIGSESDEARHTAITRLIHIYYCKVMTPDQEKQLGGLLWSNGAGNNLPGLANFRAHWFLHLPAPPHVDVQTAVKKHILALTPQGVVFKDATGRISVSATWGWEQPLILEASLASKPIIQLAGEACGLVEWTPEESKELYSKARAWWANDKQAFDVEKRSASLGLLDPIMNPLRRLGDFLARAVIPGMQWAEETDWRELNEWFQEVRAVGAFPTVALPYLLLHRPAETESVAGIIATDINSDIEEAVRAAAKAIRHWIHLSAIGRVSTPAPSLMPALIERVTFRRKSGIVACLAQLAYLVVERPQIITPNEASLLTASLIPWHQATILPLLDEAVGDFPEAERPDLRAFVGQMAGALKNWHVKSAPEAEVQTASHNSMGKFLRIRPLARN